MEFDSRAVRAAEQLRAAGYEAYLVGGCVRDALRGIEPKDYDLTTSAHPDETVRVFEDCCTAETGLKHGTVTVVFEGLPLEITTYRVDEGYSDGRRPDRVRFSGSLAEDLARRDFTVNAMAWSPETGLVDRHGGAEDLRRRVLRCVGDPKLRFSEDGLRILRALRFASVLEVSIDPETFQALISEKARLRCVSSERIGSEFRKLLCGSGVFSALRSAAPVLGEFLPEILPTVGFDQRNPHHIYDVYTHILKTVQAIPPREPLRIAAFFHDIAKPSCFSCDSNRIGHFYGHASRSADTAEAVLTRLRFEKALIRKVCLLIRHHDSPIEQTETEILRKLNRLGEAGFFDLIALKRADTAALSSAFSTRLALCDRAEETARRLLAQEACFSLRDLKINGYDLQNLGFRGAEIGAVLRFLLEEVVSGRQKNDREALLREALRFRNSANRTP